ncbi:uncharacterized protein BDW43DRAFT_188706 [Aspergillus alliaceus]|uniref:uncharacterized protein n=1 Tax=Petromyces alliaceus TaxID=209559 RepID=UPI0012A5D641|nr:uncharacterized protein BDW43DRAFT_188706 [Aspergillus alliaceus]KAB8229527.1 hypothetical protein BDW43DRAFT_188706 [Aspergillus alliaceus]
MGQLVYRQRRDSSWFPLFSTGGSIRVTLLLVVNIQYLFFLLFGKRSSKNRLSTEYQSTVHLICQVHIPQVTVLVLPQRCTTAHTWDDEGFPGNMVEAAHLTYIAIMRRMGDRD